MEAMSIAGFVQSCSFQQLDSSKDVDKDSLVRKQALYILRISLDIFSSSENDSAQQCSRRRSAALPAQDKSNTAMTKREMNQSDENCSSGKDRWKVFLIHVGGSTGEALGRGAHGGARPGRRRQGAVAGGGARRGGVEALGGGVEALGAGWWRLAAECFSCSR
uniref:Uncharacterized protein n=1 Tax=Oryza nivara TaxID=4536 RepID=A0A0E0HR14_ORYNI